jgi:Fungal Zn(2)-Cys(6) binuclear cluster domain
MEERVYTPRKRTQACIRCRSRKLKCEFTIETKNCDRCHNLGIECKIQNKKEERYTFEAVTQRLDRLEAVTGELVQFLETRFGKDLGLAGEQLKRKRSKDEYPDDDGQRESPSSRLELGSNISNTNASQNSQNGDRPTTLLESYQVKECVDYFVNNISKYLPVLIFDYMPEFQTIESKLLVTAIVAVATLFHPKYREYHIVYVSEFTSVLSQLRTNSGLVTPSASLEAIDAILNDVLGLTIAGAWLGTELGFRAILLASNMIARVMPLFMGIDSVGTMGPSVRLALELKLCAIGLVTYIIEQRLRIMHGRPVKHVSALGFGTESQLNYLFSAMTRSQAGRVKAMANVDLCAVITNYQRELTQTPPEKIISCLSYFNEQLERWLAEWFGQMTVHLRPSSWKPLFLTLLYAKLLLNLHAVDNITRQERHDTRIDPFVTAAEISAIDILDMVVYNDDMPRLISYGPVFYPTIFVTAGASLLKLIWLKHEGKPIVLNHSVESLLNLVKLAHSRLSVSIYLATMPCYESVHNLGQRLQRVTDTLRASSNSKELYNSQETWDSSRFRLWGNNNGRPAGDLVVHSPGVPIISEIVPVESSTTTAASNSEGNVLAAETSPADLLDDSIWSFGLAEGDPNFLLDVHSTNLLDSLGDVGGYEPSV